MQKTFYLVRHGVKESTPGDPALNELGHQQAQLVAKYLDNLPIDKIVSSPILRARQTAQHVSDWLKLEIEVNDLLRERVNWGDKPGQDFADFLAMWERASVERDWEPPIGDSSRKSGCRLERLITSLLPLKEKHIVLVSHGGIIGDFLRNVFEEKLFDPKLKIRECSITEVRVNGREKRFELVRYADVTHLK